MCINITNLNINAWSLRRACRGGEEVKGRKSASGLGDWQQDQCPCGGEEGPATVPGDRQRGP